MSVLESFEGKSRMVEEPVCTNLLYKGIEIDVAKRLIYRDKREIKVTFVEFEILYFPYKDNLCIRYRVDDVESIFMEKDTHVNWPNKF